MKSLLDGLNILRTSVAAESLDAADVVGACKNLAHGERDFRSDPGCRAIPPWAASNVVSGYRC